MPRNNRYNPTPAEREVQRRAVTGRAPSPPDELRPDSSWQLAIRGGAGAWLGHIERTNFATSPYQPGNQPITHEDIARTAAQLDANAYTSRAYGLTATEMRTRQEAVERQLRDIELRNQIERAVDRIQAGFRRPGDRVRLAVPEPFSLNQDMAEIAEIPPLRTIDVEIGLNGRPHIDDALVYEYARIAGSPDFRYSRPVPLKRRNQQPDGSLLDLTQPAEAML